MANSVRMVALIAWLVTALIACHAPDPIKVGFMGGLSGRVADLGVAGRNGAMLAVEQINAQGGVDGRMVELVVRDDRQDPETARQAVAQLLSLGVEVIIGPMTSGMAVATLPLVNASNAIMVSPTVTTTELTGKDDNFLRVISHTGEYAGKSARYHFTQRGLTAAAVIYDVNNRAYTESWLNDFRAAFEGLGGRILLTHPFRSGQDVVFLPSARELVAANPRLVLIIANAVDAALICQQVRKLDASLPIAIAEWASTERFIELAGSVAEGVVAPQFLDRDDASPRFRDFDQAFRSRFGQPPGFAGMAGYDAALVVLQALGKREAGRTLKETIIKLGVFQGVQQTIVMDRFGDSERGTFIAVVRDGQFVTRE